MTIPETYTTQEAAKLLKVNQRSIYRYIESGRLKAIKAQGAKQWTITEDALREFMGLAAEDE